MMIETIWWVGNKKIPIERKGDEIRFRLSPFPNGKREKPFVNSKYCSKVRNIIR